MPLYPSTSSKRRGSNAVSTHMNSAGGGASVAGGASVPGVSYGKDFEYLLQSQVEAANELSEVALLQLVLTGIAVIDLRAVHTFAPNSPSVNLACGKVVATTTVSAHTFRKMQCFVSVNSLCYNFSYSCTLFGFIARLRRTRARWRTGRT